jgi:1,4-dihydroxy-2-naphthoyl-CoA hydrolase
LARVFLREVDAAAMNAGSADTLVQHLGIEVLEVGEDFIQPFGLLHGGASVALAETLGSMAASLCVDPATQMAVGLEINANHLRAVTTGWVIGTARPIHVGRSTQVWDIRIENEAGQPVCISRLTMAVVPRAMGAR